MYFLLKYGHYGSAFTVSLKSRKLPLNHLWIHPYALWSLTFLHVSLRSCFVATFVFCALSIHQCSAPIHQRALTGFIHHGTVFSGLLILV